MTSSPLLQLIKPDITAQEVSDVQAQLESVKINNTGGELDKLQEKQRAAVERSTRGSMRHKGKEDIMIDPYFSPPTSAGVHPDLQELDFGDLGAENK